MFNIPHRLFALSFCAALAFGTASQAQNAENNDAAAAPQSDSATPPDSAAQPQSDSAAQAKSDSAVSMEQQATAPPAILGEGTKEQAEHSAEATAHKSLKDPNNQLGTSLSGRTRPVAGTENGPPYDTAQGEKPAAESQQAEQ